MSYNISLSGHKDFETREEVEKFEKDVIDLVTKFTSSLPDFSGGTISTGTQPQVVLQASDVPDETPAKTTEKKPAKAEKKSSGEKKK